MMTKDETDAKILACLERIAQSVDDTSRALAALADRVKSAHGDLIRFASKMSAKTEAPEHFRRFVRDGSQDGGHWETLCRCVGSPEGIWVREGQPIITNEVR